jgi:hypothetical protein
VAGVCPVDSAESLKTIIIRAPSCLPSPLLLTGECDSNPFCHDRHAWKRLHPSQTHRKAPISSPPACAENADILMLPRSHSHPHAVAYRNVCLVVMMCPLTGRSCAIFIVLVPTQGLPLSHPTRTHNSGPILTKVHSIHLLIQSFYTRGVIYIRSTF